jgi:hypothetical protein
MKFVIIWTTLFFAFLTLKTPLCFADAISIENDSEVKATAETSEQPRVCPPSKTIKFTQAIQYFDHIRANEGCRTGAPDHLTLQTVPIDQKQILETLAATQTIVFHCGGRPTTAWNTKSEAYQAPGTIQFENNKVTQIYYSESEKRSVTAVGDYSVVKKNPLTIKAGIRVFAFKKIKINETNETAIEIQSEHFPVCPNGGREKALLLPLQGF